jgi:hypothetical protein
VSVVARLRVLTRQDWYLLAYAVGVVATARVALSVGGVRGARPAARGAARLMRVGEVSRAPWAVAAVGRRLPGASCLTQAIALQAILARAGRPSRVEIGVAREQTFEAHAWVVCDDQIVLGGQGVERFRMVATFE